VDPVPDPLLPRKSSSAGNRTGTSGSVARNSDHRGGLVFVISTDVVISFPVVFGVSRLDVDAVTSFSFCFPDG
jgi:hypothetical protein